MTKSKTSIKSFIGKKKSSDNIGSSPDSSNPSPVQKENTEPAVGSDKSKNKEKETSKDAKDKIKAQNSLEKIKNKEKKKDEKSKKKEEKDGTCWELYYSHFLTCQVLILIFDIIAAVLGFTALNKDKLWNDIVSIVVINGHPSDMDVPWLAMYHGNYYETTFFILLITLLTIIFLHLIFFTILRWIDLKYRVVVLLWVTISGLHLCAAIFEFYSTITINANYRKHKGYIRFYNRCNSKQLHGRNSEAWADELAICQSYHQKVIAGSLAVVSSFIALIAASFYTYWREKHPFKYHPNIKEKNVGKYKYLQIIKDEGAPPDEDDDEDDEEEEEDE